MGQHLHLYASRSLTVEEVDKWCRARANELFDVPSPEDRPIVEKVQREMDRLQRTTDHLEHWSSWVGVEIWGTLFVWVPNVCDEALFTKAVEAAQVAMRWSNVEERYPGKDFTQDDVIAFLREHQGAVVWGDNDGI